MGVLPGDLCWSGWLHATLSLVQFAGWEGASITEILALLSVELATVLGVFFLGASLGSFLNVVLYRVPRRQNILWPPSHCPVCCRRIALWDNIPILSWLLLRGRCRSCQTAIPPGYLGVELLMGSLFVVLLILEVYLGGRTLPLRPPSSQNSALWTIWNPRTDVLSLYLYHSLLAYFLTSLVLFAWQGDVLPGRYVLIALAVGLIIPLLSPAVQVVPAWPVVVGETKVHTAGIASAAWGLLVGVGLGSLFGHCTVVRVCRRADSVPHWPIPTTFDVAAGLAIVGTWLGWQAVLSISLLTAFFQLISRSRHSALVVLAVLTGVQLLLWRMLTEHLPWWPGPYTSWAVMIGWAMVLLLALVAVRLMRRSPEPVREPSWEPCPDSSTPEALP